MSALPSTVGYAVLVREHFTDHEAPALLGPADARGNGPRVTPDRRTAEEAAAVRTERGAYAARVVPVGPGGALVQYAPRPGALAVGELARVWDSGRSLTVRDRDTGSIYARSWSAVAVYPEGGTLPADWAAYRPPSDPYAHDWAEEDRAAELLDRDPFTGPSEGRQDGADR